MSTLINNKKNNYDCIYYLNSKNKSKKFDHIVVDLKFNYGYVWSEIDSAYVKGYAFFDGILYKDAELAKLFSKIDDELEFEQLIKKLNGVFTVVLNRNDLVLAATDITRTFPIFYTTMGDLFITDDTFYLKKKLGLKINKSAIIEFLRCGYAIGNQTLLNNVFQLQAGEYLKADKDGLKTKLYYNYTGKINEIKQIEYYSLKKDFIVILNNLIRRLVSFAKGDFIVIPLSGGYDSRLLASLLKMHGYKNVLCYTYGKPDSPEVVVSKKVAEKLGFEWYFVNYSKELCENYTQKQWFNELYMYAFNHVSTIHLQDLLAFKRLVDCKLIPDSAIVCPGHSGDFLGGSHLRKLPLPDRDSLVSTIFEKHFVLNEHIDCDEVIKLRLREYCESYRESLPHTVDENWNFKERQAKYIVNSNRNYEFFGHRHVIPLWDLELVEFFRTLPLVYKTDRVLYQEAIISDIFKPLDVAFPKKSTIMGTNAFRRIRFYAEKKLPCSVKRPLRDALWKDVNNMRFVIKPLLQETKRKWYFSETPGIVAEWCLKKIKQVN